jgi:hypothetical protein
MGGALPEPPGSCPSQARGAARCSAMLRGSPAGTLRGARGRWAAHHHTEDPPHTSSLLQEVQGSVEPGNNAGLRSDAVLQVLPTVMRKGTWQC